MKHRCPAFQEEETHPSGPVPKGQCRCPASIPKKNGNPTIQRPSPLPNGGSQASAFPPQQSPSHPASRKKDPDVLSTQTRRGTQVSCPPHQTRSRASCFPQGESPGVLLPPPVGAQAKGEIQTFCIPPHQRNLSKLPFPNKSPAILSSAKRGDPAALSLLQWKFKHPAHSPKQNPTCRPNKGPGFASPHHGGAQAPCPFHSHPKVATQPSCPTLPRAPRQHLLLRPRQGPQAPGPSRRGGRAEPALTRS